MIKAMIVTSLCGVLLAGPLQALAQAASGRLDLLPRALSCQLQTSELADLMPRLAAENPDFKKPFTYLTLPAADLYRLSRPVQALGYVSDRIVVSPARIAMVLDDATMEEVAQRLQLQQDDSLGTAGSAMRALRSNVSLWAHTRHTGHAKTPQLLLVGCQYASQAATNWMADDAILNWQPPRP